MSFRVKLDLPRGIKVRIAKSISNKSTKLCCCCCSRDSRRGLLVQITTFRPLLQRANANEVR